MKVGFICEGMTEKKIVDSANFQQFLKSIGIECVADVINAEGNGNLLPKNLPQHSQILESKGAERIIILTDLDADACITVTKNRIGTPANHIVIIAVKQIEAWFLADDVCMSVLCGQPFHFNLPEQETDPFQTIRQQLINYTGNGVRAKILLVERMLNNNFSILNAATHPNCPSAKYFIQKLKALNPKNN